MGLLSDMLWVLCCYMGNCFPIAVLDMPILL